MGKEISSIYQTLYRDLCYYLIDYGVYEIEKVKRPAKAWLGLCER